MSSRVPGFSLLEVALVLMILGVVGAMSVPLFTRYLNAEKRRITTERQERILKHLGYYFVAHGMLPCPSDPSNIGTDKEGNPLSKCHELPDTSVPRGIVPYKTLDLPAKDVKDGYGRWMTYLVCPGTTTSEKKKRPVESSRGGFQRHSEKISVAEAIQKIKEETDFEEQEVILPFCEPYNERKIIVVLISHGKQGHGAYTQGGQIMVASPSAIEITNATSGRHLSARGEQQVMFSYPRQLLYSYAQITLCAKRDKKQRIKGSSGYAGSGEEKPLKCDLQVDEAQ